MNKGDVYKRQHMLVLSHICDYETALRRVQDTLDSGEALERLRLMIEAQGGNIHVINDESLLAIGKFTYDVTAPQDGYITHMNTCLLYTSRCV